MLDQFLLNNMQIANELNSEVVNKLSSLRDQVAEQVGAVSVRQRDGAYTQSLY